MPALHSNFLGGTVDNSPSLAIGGTTLESTGLAELPAVAAPNYMWLVLDPAGDAGDPEIVKVTAHTAAATTATIARAQQSTTARAHLVSTTWIHSFTEDDISTLREPPGVIKEYAGTSAPSGYLMADGSAVSRTDYADLFSVISTTFGSGDGSTTFNVPDRRERFAVGVGTVTHTSLGGTGGSKDATLPAHTHTGPAHTHTGPAHTHTGPAHTHTINHDHAAATTSADGQHTHTIEGGGTDGTAAFVRTASGGLGATPDTNPDGSHTHTLNLPNFTGTSGSGGTGDTGSSGTGATGSSGTGATSSAGTSATDANLPPYINLNFIIKT